MGFFHFQNILCLRKERGYMDKNIILANTLIDYSLRVEEGENVLINADSHETYPLVKELVKKIKSVKANVEVRFNVCPF